MKLLVTLFFLLQVFAIPVLIDHIDHIDPVLISSKLCRSDVRNREHHTKRRNWIVSVINCLIEFINSNKDSLSIFIIDPVGSYVIVFGGFFPGISVILNSEIESEANRFIKH